MGDLNFKFCPVCGNKLKIGQSGISFGFSHLNSILITWLSEEECQWQSEHPIKSVFTKTKTENFKNTYVKPYENNIPSGYCEKCNKIFAELDIRNEDNPIG